MQDLSSNKQEGEESSKAQFSSNTDQTRPV